MDSKYYVFEFRTKSEHHLTHNGRKCRIIGQVGCMYNIEFEDGNRSVTAWPEEIFKDGVRATESVILAENPKAPQPGDYVQLVCENHTEVQSATNTSKGWVITDPQGEDYLVVRLPDMDTPSRKAWKAIA